MGEVANRQISVAGRRHHRQRHFAESLVHSGTDGGNLFEQRRIQFLVWGDAFGFLAVDACCCVFFEHRTCVGFRHHWPHSVRATP
ncbi:hypothetical protein D9M70_605310 [compost metagenome]